MRPVNVPTCLQSQSALKTPLEFPVFRPAGDQALVVELGAGIDRASNGLVRSLDTALSAASWPGIRGTVPSYRSLLVYYDPITVSYAELIARLRVLSESPRVQQVLSRRWRLPVLYGEDCLADLTDLADKLQMSPAEVVETHTAPEYMVYMMGFSPGFSYLGELPKRLEVPRKLVPAKSVPANSLQVGGAQTALSSMPMPSGWYVIGRTPAKMYDLRREQPFLLAGGDSVSFYSIGADEFAVLSADAEAGRWSPQELET